MTGAHAYKEICICNRVAVVVIIRVDLEQGRSLSKRDGVKY